MANKAQWTKDIKSGKLGERKLESLLQYRGHTNIVDRSGDKPYQELDIDFTSNNCNGCPIKSEAKYASIDGGHDLLEVVKNSNTGAAGWAVASAADIVTVYKKPMSEIHVLNMRTVILWLADHMNDPTYRHFDSANYGKGGKINYYSENIMVPYKELISSGMLMRIWAEKNNGTWIQTFPDRDKN